MTKLLGISVLSLLAAFAVYLFARIYLHEILIPFLATGSKLSSYIGIFVGAPSFYYSLPTGLLIAFCAWALSHAVRHCLFRIVLILPLEISRHPSLAELDPIRLATVEPESCREIGGPRWARGVFDPKYLITTLMGRLIALVLLIYVPKEKHNAHIR